MKRLVLMCGVLGVVAVSFVISHHIARVRSDVLIAKVPEPEPWERTGSRFVLRSTAGSWGPSWEFDYESKDYFGPGPLTVHMSLFAQPLATNPPAALAELRRIP